MGLPNTILPHVSRSITGILLEAKKWLAVNCSIKSPTYGNRYQRKDSTDVPGTTITGTKIENLAEKDHSSSTRMYPKFQYKLTHRYDFVVYPIPGSIHTRYTVGRDTMLIVAAYTGIL